MLNAATHGHASTVRITITRSGNDVIVTVDDNGFGPPQVPQPVGSGSAIIGSWTDVLMGSCGLTLLPEGGARLLARFPIKPALRR